MAAEYTRDASIFDSSCNSVSFDNFCNVWPNVATQDDDFAPFCIVFATIHR